MRPTTIVLAALLSTAALAADDFAAKRKPVEPQRIYTDQLVVAVTEESITEIRTLGSDPSLLGTCDDASDCQEWATTVCESNGKKRKASDLAYCGWSYDECCITLCTDGVSASITCLPLGKNVASIPLDELVALPAEE